MENTIQSYNDNYIWNPVPTSVRVKKTTRTVERYDTEGKLINKEVITEEEEFYDKQEWVDSNPRWYPPYEVTCSVDNISLSN